MGEMRPEIKFCGLMRVEDAAMAASLGARYVGVIFAGGPRALTPERARVVLDGAGRGVKRVGVFGTADPGAIADVVAAALLDVVQLHGDPAPSDVEAVRARTRCEIWSVVRVDGGVLPEGTQAAFEAADAVLLDARVSGRLGGTGVALPWDALAPAVAPLRTGHRVVLAGGLTPENVGHAIGALAPDVVDVSSGVERGVGEKDHQRMRMFVEAVQG